MSFTTVRSALQRFEQMGIVRNGNEIIGRKRNEMYAYEKALAVLELGCWNKFILDFHIRVKVNRQKERHLVEG